MGASERNREDPDWDTFLFQKMSRMMASGYPMFITCSQNKMTFRVASTIKSTLTEPLCSHNSRFVSFIRKDFIQSLGFYGKAKKE